MGSSRDSAPDPNHASSSACPPVPIHAWSSSPSNIAPMTPPRPPRVLLGPEAKVSPPVAVPPSDRPLGCQPNLLDRLRRASPAREVC